MVNFSCFPELSWRRWQPLHVRHDMLVGYDPIVQALFGTLFTWGLTAAGSATVFFFNGYKRSFLDASLGFAAGVMTAASFWSLLLPALEITAQTYEENKFLSLVPVLVGFILGAFFVHLTDVLLPDDYMGAVTNESGRKSSPSDSEEIEKQIISEISNSKNADSLRHRQFDSNNNKDVNSKGKIMHQDKASLNDKAPKKVFDTKFRKIVLLIIAVTVHNIPEGLAVGVGFGAIGKSKSATFQNARNLAFGIGIQNFPEGLAVSLPLYASGFSYWRSFWYGQLSGMVEPMAGILGALGIGLAQSVLPYALAFAAGAMLYVVFENLMPEATSNGNSKLATWFCMIGFCVMMCLDVGLN